MLERMYMTGGTFFRWPARIRLLAGGTDLTGSARRGELVTHTLTHRRGITLDRREAHIDLTALDSSDRGL